MLALLLELQTAPADIVVTGLPIIEAQAKCAKGNCTPLRDAQTTIALAEAEFRQGKYLNAKRLLATAVARNRDNAKTAPIPVAALYEAYATVALHEGDRDAYQQAVAGRVRTLRENLPAKDPAVVAAATALGDMWFKRGDYRQADVAYRSVERDAVATGQDMTAIVAGMKRAWLAAALGDANGARRKLNELEGAPFAARPGFATALKVLRLRIAALTADGKEIDRLSSELGQHKGAQPVLIWAPPYEPDAVAAANLESQKFDATEAIKTTSSDVARVGWADIGFWIRPDGRTAEAEVLRGSLPKASLQLALGQIAARRYSQIERSDDAGTVEKGVYRIERYSRGARYTTPTGSLIVRRVARGGFETLDLSDDGATRSATDK